MNNKQNFKGFQKGSLGNSTKFLHMIGGDKVEGNQSLVHTKNCAQGPLSKPGVAMASPKIHIFANALVLTQT